MVEPMRLVNLHEFAAELKARVTGDWWDKVPPYRAGEWMGDCECCGQHLLSEKRAAQLNAILTGLREQQAPAPWTAYGHCDDEVIVEWKAADTPSGAALFLSDMTCLMSPDQRWLNLVLEASS